MFCMACQFATGYVKALNGDMVEAPQTAAFRAHVFGFELVNKVEELRSVAAEGGEAT